MAARSGLQLGSGSLPRLLFSDLLFSSLHARRLLISLLRTLGRRVHLGARISRIGCLWCFGRLWCFGCLWCA